MTARLNNERLAVLLTDAITVAQQHGSNNAILPVVIRDAQWTLASCGFGEAPSEPATWFKKPTLRLALREVARELLISQSFKGGRTRKARRAHTAGLLGWDYAFFLRIAGGAA